MPEIGVRERRGYRMDWRRDERGRCKIWKFICQLGFQNERGSTGASKHRVLTLHECASERGGNVPHRHLCRSHRPAAVRRGGGV